jgi:formylmethanofuran dehydrogenase subunit A
MKHAYTDESWETALQDIKLYRIFVFDIVMMKKPLFPNWKEKKKNEEKKEKEIYKDLKDHFGIQYSEDLENKKEKNKYVIL